MNQAKLKALTDMLQGVPAAKIKALIEGHTTKAMKTAELQGMRFKAPEPVYTLPGGGLAVLVNGRFKAVQPADPMAEEEAAVGEVAAMSLADLEETVRAIVEAALAELKDAEVAAPGTPPKKPKKAPAAPELPTALTQKMARYGNAGDRVAVWLGFE